MSGPLTPGLLDATGPVVDANLSIEWYYDLLSAETEAAGFLTEGGSGYALLCWVPLTEPPITSGLLGCR